MSVEDKIAKGREAGLSDSEIVGYFQRKGKNNGLSNSEINSFLSRYKLLTPETAAVMRQEKSQQVMTDFQEKGFPLEETRKAATAALPIAGDIAGTMLAAGSGVGAPAAIATKFPKIVKGVDFGIKLGSRMLGSGAGSFGGSVAKDVLRGDEIDFPTAKREAAVGATTEGALGIAGATLKASGNFGKFLMQTAADFTPFGKNVQSKVASSLKKSQKEFIQKTTQRADNFIKSFGNTPNKADSGLKIGDVFKEKDSYERAYKLSNEVIDKIAETSGGDIVLTDTVKKIQDDLISRFKFGKRTENQALSDALKWMRIKADSKEAWVIRDMMRGNSVEPDDAKFILKKIWKGYKGDPKKLIRWKEDLKKTISNDIEKYNTGSDVTFVDANEIGDKIYGNTKNWFSENLGAKRFIGKMGKSSSKGKLYYEEYPERALDNLLTKEPYQLAEIKKVILSEPGGKEAWAGVELNVLDNIFSSAMREAEGSGAKRFLPAKFADEVYKNESKIKAVSGNDTWLRIKKEADYSRSIAEKFETIDVDGAQNIFSAFGVLHPKTQKVLSGTTKALGIATKGLTKAGAHLTLGGEEVGF